MDHSASFQEPRNQSSRLDGRLQRGIRLAVALTLAQVAFSLASAIALVVAQEIPRDDGMLASLDFR